MTKARLEQLMLLQPILNVRFRNISFLNHALIHRSYVHENKLKVSDSNERMEFLGDSVLGLVISSFLYKKYHNLGEGDLSKLKGNIVSASGLAKKALSLKFGDYILLGRGEILTGGRVRPSILANTLEAIIGAIYLDSGLKPAENFIVKQFAIELSGEIKEKLEADSKSLLQEKIQAQFKKAPHYKEMKAYGPEHKKTFEIGVFLNGEIIGKGVGNSKKEAEQNAAKTALKRRW
ncbi:MAG: ribonuclease III [Candidatus Firestonebacteria bacterium]